VIYVLRGAIALASLAVVPCNGDCPRDKGTGLVAWSPVQTPAPTPGIHYTPTRHAVADAMLTLASVGPGDVVVDLGSGDGRIVIIAAQKYGARGVGIELDAKLIEQSRQNARDAGVEDRVTFTRADLFAADLSTATVVALYLSPSMNRELAPKLQKELKPGTRVVSHQFPMPGWTPTERTTYEGSELFLYRLPAR
jgi:protein-L-isoaspartate O-methyltransferase